MKADQKDAKNPGKTFMYDIGIRVIDLFIYLLHIYLSSSY